jgi:hypothetical protein
VIKSFSLVIVLNAPLLLLLAGCEQNAVNVGDSQRLDSVAQALVAYKDQFNCFPPVLLTDQSDQHFHSWRVLVLPFLEANSFSEEYDFSTPWNSEKNIDLVNGTRWIDREKFPNPSLVGKVFANPRDSESYKTSILMVVECAMRTDVYQKRLPQDDAPQLNGMYISAPEKLVLIEVTTSGVHWMEPRDIVMSKDIFTSFIPIEAIKDQIVRSIEVGDSAVIRNRIQTLEFLGI